MADNITIKDGAGVDVTMRSTNTAGIIQVPMSIPTNTAGNAAAFGSGANGATVPRVALATDSPGASIPVKLSSNFTAAGTTPTYVSGEWISDNGTAGSVTKSTWTVVAGAGTIRRVKIRKSDQTVATPTIRLYLWDTTFTVAVGNDAAGAQPFADSIGFLDVPVTTAGTDDAVGWTSCDIPFVAGTLFGLLQSQSSFTGATSEVWTIELTVVPG